MILFSMSQFDTLRALLHDEEIRHDIEHVDMRIHPEESKLLTDYCDGYIYKTHPLFMSDSHAMQIILYFDEIEVCNPLGAHIKKQTWNRTVQSCQYTSLFEINVSNSSCNSS